MITKKFIKASVTFFAMFAVFITNSYNTKAAENAEVTIQEYVTAINEQNWDAVANLYCTGEADDMESFVNDEDNSIERNGMFNIQSCQLKELVEVNMSDVKDMLYKDYSGLTAKVFVLGVDCEVYSDDKYFSTGVNYDFITCILEDDAWKISELIAIENPQYLLDCGYQFSDDFNMAVNVMKARENGQYINYEGQEYDSVDDSSMNQRTVLNKRTVPTDKTVVRLLTSSGKITKPKFHEYCLGVLAGELRSSSFDGQVRRAQAIAIKTFTWHYLIVPQNSAKGYDISYASQSYQPTKVSENSVVTTDYNAVKNVWMESNGGAIFAAYYRAGEYSDQSNYKNGGIFRQNGALWLYKNNKATSYKNLLKYYYDSSSASTGGSIRFFDSNKNEF